MSGQKSQKNISQSTKGATVSTTTASNTMLPRKRMTQNYLVIWVDASIDPATEDCKNTLKQLRNIVNEVNPCTSVAQCIQVLKENNGERAFVISSGALGQHLLPDIHNMTQLDTIYIFCSNKQRYEEWSKKWTKIKGVYTAVKPICEALQMTVKQCNQDDISVSIISVNEGGSSENLNQLEPSFMYSQIFKEILLDMEHGQQAVKDLVKFCRELYMGNMGELNIIDEFERTYRPPLVIWWYTRECFTYDMLNRALRTLDGDIIIRMGFFLCDLHREIESLYKKQVSHYHEKTFLVFRGQRLLTVDFDKLEKNKGGLISFSNFLSTSKNRDISLSFAQCAFGKPDMVGILFQISIDPTISSTPFASIQDVSYFKNEDEILFSMHTVFRIGEVKKIDIKRPLYQVELKLTADDDKQLRQLTERIRQEAAAPTGWTRLGKLLLKIGQFNKAEELYTVLLEQTSDDDNRPYIYHQLGWLKDDQGKYKEAASFYEKSLEIYQKTLPKDHPSLASSYNNIGLVYKKMGDYSKALEFYEKDLEITKKALPLNQPSLATSYNNIGQVYNNMGDYSKALEFYEKAHHIFEKALPANHPDLATSYNNIGSVYDAKGDYTKALEFYEKDMEIKKKALPPYHPTLATSYNNIGLVYKSMGNYSKALEFYEKDLEITGKVLPPDHPDLATSYNNIGSVYDDMGNYAKALELYEKAVTIKEKLLPLNYPDLAISYNNIGLLYENRGEYLKASQFYKRAVETAQHTLASDHPHIQVYKKHLQGVKQKL